LTPIGFRERGQRDVQTLLAEFEEKTIRLVQSSGGPRQTTRGPGLYSIR
jgi:hypothetical protein